jgi:hypothetical protein
MSNKRFGVTNGIWSDGYGCRKNAKAGCNDSKRKIEKHRFFMLFE